MVYNSLWSANERRRGQMINPKEALTATYDGREQIQMGISLELLGIVFIFYSFAPPLMPPSKNVSSHGLQLIVECKWKKKGTNDTP